MILDFTACRVVKTERFERFTSLLQLLHVPLATAHSPYVVILVVDGDQKHLPEIFSADLLAPACQVVMRQLGRATVTACTVLAQASAHAAPPSADAIVAGLSLMAVNKDLQVQLPQPRQLVQGAEACYVEGGPAGHQRGRRS